jgi:hypothetical protein
VNSQVSERLPSGSWFISSHVLLHICLYKLMLDFNSFSVDVLLGLNSLECKPSQRLLLQGVIEKIRDPVRN